MKAKFAFALVSGLVVLVAILAVYHLRTQPPGPALQLRDENLSAQSEETPPQKTMPPVATASPVTRMSIGENPIFHRVPEAVATNKLERLAQIRDTFRVLAAGDPTAALRAAKQIGDETERETALLTLVTQWTHGELSSPRERARAIDLYGLEAGLGIELVKDPDLAVLWANELTDGAGCAALLQQTAIAMINSNPAAAFALSEQLSPGEQRGFFDAVFAGWASKDTEAALQWADQLPEAAQRDAAMVAIRSVAPVGIGAALRVQDGYPVVNQVLPGTAAELSGQLHPGDRILALAQGGGAFVDTRSLSLADVVQMIRGAPGTQLQLQIQAADAPLNSPPRAVSIIRDQIKFKR